MLAYYETVRDGLVPVKIGGRVVEDGIEKLSLTVTGSGRTVYRRGDALTVHPCRVIPRDKVRRRRYSTTILPFSWHGVEF